MICGSINRKRKLWKYLSISILLLFICNMYILFQNKEEKDSQYNIKVRQSAIISLNFTSTFDENKSNLSATDDVVFSTTLRPELFVRKNETAASSPSSHTNIEMQGTSLNQTTNSSNVKYEQIPFVVNRTMNLGPSHEKQSVCLASHTSIDSLYSVVEQAEAWQGPMSVTVYVPGRDFSVAKVLIKILRSCSLATTNFVTFIFVRPLTNVTVTIDDIDIPAASFNCSISNDWKSILPLMSKRKETDNLIMYPQNLMRNIARNNCPTNQSITVDVDMIPNQNLYKMLDEFIRTTTICTKCAYVFPLYEIKNETMPPKDKPSLLHLVQTNDAQMFHKEVYSVAQSNTNFIRWQKTTPKSPKKIEAIYKRKYKEYWEPLIMIHSSAPSFDENFVGFGFTRSSHMYMLHTLRYQFVILNNAFFWHRNFYNKSYINNYSQQRKDQINRNRLQYKTFKLSLQTKYPKMKKKKLRS